MIAMWVKRLLELDCLNWLAALASFVNLGLSGVLPVCTQYIRVCETQEVCVAVELNPGPQPTGITSPGTTQPPVVLPLNVLSVQPSVIAGSSTQLFYSALVYLTKV